jgi:DNA uptake protein ComE-like DNA-binding protein
MRRRIRVSLLDEPKRSFMKCRFISVALAAAVLTLGAGQTIAADTPAVVPQVAASKATSSQKSKADRQKAIAAQRKAAARIKQVDINSASSDELMKLPGVDEADAAKIIAGRPYGSKSWLMTHKVLSAEKYQAISSLIAAKNAARHTKKK